MPRAVIWLQGQQTLVEEVDASAFGSERLPQRSKEHPLVSEGYPQGSGGPSLGLLLQGMGTQLIGRKVMMFWPDDGKWYEAEVTEYQPRTMLHT